MVLAFLSSGCTHFFYQPTSDVYVKPEAIPNRPSEEKVPIENDQLSVWVFAPAHSNSDTPVVIQFHGNGENMTSHFFSLYWAVEQGIDLVTFDYRGYGQSTGKASPENTIEDGVALVEWTSRRFPKRTLVLHGQSLGGAISLKVAQRLKEENPDLHKRIHSLIVENTFASYKSVAADALSKSWLTWSLQPLAYILVTDRVAPKDKLGELAPTPLLVIHQQEDPIVSFEQGRTLFEKASQPKEFWPIEQRGHVSTFLGPKKMKYREQYLSWLKKPVPLP
jgi:alpha-beta hydrolase superfamily lysophospholipase